ncbi:MAG TPA: 3-deoxy-7-phosphoheptulonate synthase [Candidatus Sulfotelmatobacter sp.]|nr:3-deoxy-7-phosphoheptulonate synthase [Candidatus Sulfotelmatobacter sp.]
MPIFGGYFWRNGALGSFGGLCEYEIFLLGSGPRKGMAMIISMKRHATREEIDAVTNQVNHFGYKVHSIEGEERVVIGVVGVGDVTACLESIEAMPQVENVMRISAPYKFVSREFRKEKTLIRVNGTVIGGDQFVVIAGPCSVESEEQILRSAEGVVKAGAKLLRGGAFKPRTSPYDFQGMEEQGLKLLQKAKKATGLGIVTEVMSDRDVDLVANYADVLQIGARNMQNFVLLKALGKCGRPILLKRGLSSTVKELLMSAEYIVAHGNPDVMLCERGIRTFETVTRNTCDITAIPALNELTHLPVILDPSHATGRRSLVPALARAGVAIGADALIVEVHPAPEKAISDGAQSLDMPQFAKMMEELKPYIELWKDSRRNEFVSVAAR